MIKLARAALAAGLIVTAAFAGTADAAPKARQIAKSYTATAAIPDPLGNSLDILICEGPVPGSKHVTTIKLPAEGTMKVELTAFDGDWDLLLRSTTTKKALAASAKVQPVEGPIETVLISVVRATTIDIVACNWAGGPTAKVAWTFTYR